MKTLLAFVSLEIVAVMLAAGAGAVAIFSFARILRIYRSRSKQIKVETSSGVEIKVNSKKISTADAERIIKIFTEKPDARKEQ